MPYLNGGGSVSTPKQKPLQPPHRLPTQPSGMEPHSIISSRSLRNFRDVVGGEQQKKTVTGPTRKRGTLSSLRARTRHPKLSPTPAIGCLSKRRGHNFSYRSWRDSSRFLATRSSTCGFFLRRSASYKHRSSETRCAKRSKSAVRHATRRVKNMRGWYV